MTCNGSGLRETLLSSVATDESAQSSKRKSDLEKWAALLAAGVAQVGAQSTPAGFGTPPEAWHGDVEAMTPDSPGDVSPSAGCENQPQTHAVTNGSGDDLAENQLQVRVQVADVGELALVVERSQDGVKLQISAQDHGILRAMAAEKEALASALAGAGLANASIAFVEMDRVGINLAQQRLNPSTQTRIRREDKNQESLLQQQPRRKSRKLNMVG